MFDFVSWITRRSSKLQPKPSSIEEGRPEVSPLSFRHAFFVIVHAVWLAMLIRFISAFGDSSTSTLLSDGNDALLDAASMITGWQLFAFNVASITYSTSMLVRRRVAAGLKAREADLQFQKLIDCKNALEQHFSGDDCIHLEGESSLTLVELLELKAEIQGRYSKGHFLAQDGNLHRALDAYEGALQNVERVMTEVAIRKLPVIYQQSVVLGAIVATVLAGVSIFVVPPAASGLIGSEAALEVRNYFIGMVPAFYGTFYASTLQQLAMGTGKKGLVGAMYLSPWLAYLAGKVMQLFGDVDGLSLGLANSAAVIVSSMFFRNLLFKDERFSECSLLKSYDNARETLKEEWDSGKDISAQVSSELLGTLGMIALVNALGPTAGLVIEIDLAGLTSGILAIFVATHMASLEIEDAALKYRYQHVHMLSRAGQAFTGLISSSMFAVFVLAPGSIIKLFNTSELSRTQYSILSQEVVMTLLINGVVQFADGARNTMAASLRGLYDTKYARNTGAGIVGFCGFFISWGTGKVFALLNGSQLAGICVGRGIAILTADAFLFSRWAQKSTNENIDAFVEEARREEAKEAEQLSLLAAADLEENALAPVGHETPLSQLWGAVFNRRGSTRITETTRLTEFVDGKPSTYL